MFLDAVGGHARCNINYDPSHFLLQQLDYLDFIDIYHERIKAFHVKDAEFNPTGRQGVYSGYQGWINRAGRFRSLGDGQVDFSGIFSRLTTHGYDSWAVLEWECCLKHPEDGAAEGAPFIAHHLIRVTEKAFDDFAGGDDGQADAAQDDGHLAAAAARRGRESMAIEGKSEKASGPIRYGMVGGGQGAFIGGGASHRGAHGRRVRAGRRRAVVRPGAGQGLGRRTRPRSGTQLRLLRRDGQGRGEARRTASRPWRSSRPTTCTSRPPRRFWRPASMSSATSR